MYKGAKNMKFKCALVTGASRGIGSSIAKRLAEDGINVCINYLSSKDKALALCDEINSSNGGRAIVVKADVSNEKDVKKMVKTCVEKFGGIDILVNNAGVDDACFFCDQNAKEMDRIIDINIKGMLNTCHEVLPLMISKKYGKIVNISSVFGVTGGSFEAVYSASKGAVISFSKALAKEVGPSGINVNVVAPGYIETDMNKNVEESYKKVIESETPIGRLGTPEDVASAVAFLSSDEASFITGAVLPVTGGWQV